MKRLLGLYREPEFSPGRHATNDRILLEEIAQHLRARDFEIALAHLENADGELARADVILSMCQGRSALEKLAERERAGQKIFNSPRAALNTHRDRLPQLMRDANIPFPPTQLLRTDERAEFSESAWLKRGDVHASVSADVQRIESREELDEGLAEFAARGISRVALQTHRAGDEIKFYGLAGAGNFFHWFHSSEKRGYAFAVEELEALARRAATSAGLEIFGGDIIVSPEGELTLIDLNDWPSFAPCRAAAAEAIANFVTEKIGAR